MAKSYKRLVAENQKAKDAAKKASVKAEQIIHANTVPMLQHLYKHALESAQISCRYEDKMLADNLKRILENPFRFHSIGSMSNLERIQDLLRKHDIYILAEYGNGGYDDGVEHWYLRGFKAPILASDSVQ